MVTLPNGTRYNYTQYYDQVLNQPYNYAREGLLKHLVSKRLVTSENSITRFMYQVFEKQMVFVLKYADLLANFKNPFFRNR